MVADNERIRVWSLVGERLRRAKEKKNKIKLN